MNNQNRILVTNNNEAYAKMAGTMTKIRSGQAFLYREHGEESTVIDIRMKETISWRALEQAMIQAFQRYPYFTSKLHEENGDFYLVENELPFILLETSDLHPLGHLDVNEHLLDITYSGSVIHVAFHHGLCDGGGIKPFIETLIYYYCAHNYASDYIVPGIRLAEEPLLNDEMKEPFVDGMFLDAQASEPMQVKDGFALPEINATAEQHYYRYEIGVDYEAFLAFAKANKATPSIMLSLLLSKAIKKVHPETEEPIVCHLASDMRTALNLEHTFRNCVNSLTLPYTKELEELSLSEQAVQLRALLNAQKAHPAIRSDANKMIYLSDKLDEQDTYENKKQMMTFFNNISLNTFILSYLGQINLGKNEQYVDSIHMYSSGTTGLVVNMIAASNTFAVDILQSFDSEQYITAFEQELAAHDLPYTISSKIMFATPKGK